MTVAICIRCGSKKHGALTPCPKCSFNPTENTDKAKAMILTDHLQSVEDLERIAERIRTGQSVVYPEEVVAEYKRAFEAGEDRLPAGFKYGCLVAAILVGLVIGYLVSGGT